MAAFWPLFLGGFLVKRKPGGLCLNQGLHLHQQIGAAVGDEQLDPAKGAGADLVGVKEDTDPGGSEVVGGVGPQLAGNGGEVNVAIVGVGIFELLEFGGQFGADLAIGDCQQIPQQQFIAGSGAKDVGGELAVAMGAAVIAVLFLGH
ncbi:hypothetical protein ACWI_05200 [Acetobacterium wieringae]|uniref:Uncharacterized protein n=1 Tax=Acetobacterium wieringae TaxID=52694 RepID=A0A1F2PMX8_9FIRM|nr:hypothetical protein [Acetobacterium wieringae]OFV72046.1 hypothetical protein ACWI_05200 [Acetobacterium wieringae]